MCGIVGVWGESEAAPLDSMLESIVHRGPDEAGRFVDHDADVAMGARRLSIVDLEGGSQPVYNEDGSVAVVFNGEIYNHEALRDRLESEGHTFETACDTEVLVHLWEEYGERMPEHLNGMFAFSIWDAADETLFLARDRLGIKPLYCARSPDRVVWGSEIQPLLLAGVDPTLDPSAVYRYFTLQYTPSPQTLFEHVRKVPPGTSLTISDGEVTERSYWSATDWFGKRRTGDVASRVRELLDDAVRKRLMADVPLGVFLSGGLDSSAIVALMDDHSDEPIDTFSVSFTSSTVDESQEARFVADHFGTNHHEVEVDVERMDVFEELVSSLGEPVADPALLPTLLLSKRASQNVKTVLTGEGADELFCGYYRYASTNKRRRILKNVPKPLYRLATSVGSLTGIYDETLARNEVYVDEAELLFESARRFSDDPDVTDDVDQDAEEQRFRDLVAEVSERADGTTMDKVLAYDVSYWLPDNLLYKVDQATMASSLEARVPFLDHRLVEYALGIPPAQKISADANKPVLERAVGDLLPERTLNREKHGFYVPVDEWFRTDHEPIAKWLTESRLEATPYLDADAVFQCWDEHRRGDADNSTRLWTTLNFVAWYETVVKEYGKRTAAPAD